MPTAFELMVAITQPIGYVAITQPVRYVYSACTNRNDMSMLDPVLINDQHLTLLTLIMSHTRTSIAIVQLACCHVYSVFPTMATSKK